MTEFQYGAYKEVLKFWGLETMQRERWSVGRERELWDNRGNCWGFRMSVEGTRSWWAVAVQRSWAALGSSGWGAGEEHCEGGHVNPAASVGSTLDKLVYILCLFPGSFSYFLSLSVKKETLWILLTLSLPSLGSCLWLFYTQCVLRLTESSFICFPIPLLRHYPSTWCSFKVHASWSC